MTTGLARVLAISLAILSFITSPVFAQDTIKVGMSGRYFPFTFVQKDQLQGFEVDIWDEIGKRADLKVEYKTANFSGLFGMLEAGHIDTISNQITMTDERLAKYDFAQAYVVDGAQIVVKKGRDDINTVADLKGKKVAVNLGSNFEQLLRQADPNKEINIITYDAGFEQDVVLGRTDAFVMDRVSSAQLIKKSGLPLQLAGEPFATIKNAMPFVKSETNQALIERVNQALSSMKQDGTLTQISIKWFDADITQ
ncbi:amino acid ABC transporter substrate-binding protein [Motilimonas sp. KMU-193]|uniref:amino acid ABC transporter substrate-binding protein n=1 Tax=Motilimonas sp. KMU-193 TaxID=3388668 RepID=UPI00396B1BC9